jgi:hypothetical protein
MRLLCAILSVAAAVFTASALAAPRDAARVFISGHSLVDEPMPSNLEAIARALGKTIQWNRQYVVGSSIRERTRGPEASDGWAGYRMGYNRQGQGLDVIAELRQPRTTDGQPYDTLIITEQHAVLETLVWNDTVRYLRHYHDRFIEGNARGQTYFYEPWLDVGDKNDPQRWIAYERAAAPVWQCIVVRVNHSLAAEGRSDRIVSLPASTALADLIERATRGRVPGISAARVSDTVDRIFEDTVHLTALGSYYMGLVSYSTVYGRSPLGAWAPQGVTPEQARALQQHAWEWISRYYANYRPPTLDQCDALAEGFVVPYWSYVRDTYWRREIGSAQARFRWLRNVAGWRWRFSRDNADDPFHYDPETDRSYWFAPP